MNSVPDTPPTVTRRLERILFRFMMGAMLALVVLAIIIPGMMRACGCATSETLAVGSLRNINSAQSTFSSSCGGNGYAQSLQDLAKPPSGSTAGFISSDLSKNGVIRRAKSGGFGGITYEYVITVMAGLEAEVVTPASQTCNGSEAGAVSHYFAEAHPLRAGEFASYAIDERGTIYVNRTGQPIAPGMAGASVLQ